MTLKRILRLWNEMWFNPTSPSPICVFRILFGLLVIFMTLMWIPDIFHWFGPDGLASIETVHKWSHGERFSLLFYLPRDNSSVVLLYTILIIAAIFLTIGLFTNWSAAILFICLVSFHHRMPVVLNSGDTLMRLFALLLAFSPAGKMYSLDSLIRRKKSLVKETEKILASPWVQRLIQLQIAAVYCQTIFAKLKGSHWWDGSAVYYACRIEEFYRFPVPYVIDHMWTIQILTWGTILIELALWTLIWIKEFRYYVLAAGVALHLGIEWSMNIPGFEWLMIASFVNFVYPEDVEKCVSWLRQKIHKPAADT